MVYGTTEKQTIKYKWLGEDSKMKAETKTARVSARISPNVYNTLLWTVWVYLRQWETFGIIPSDKNIGSLQITTI